MLPNTKVAIWPYLYLIIAYFYYFYLI